VLNNFSGVLKMAILRKLFKFGLLGMLLIIVAVVLGIWMVGERVLKVGVEKAASKTLGVDVVVDDIGIAPFRGQLGIKGLEVRNPAGYELKNLLELNQGDVQVTLKSLMGDTVKIDYFRLDGINLVLEQKGMTNNLQEILNNMEKPDAKPAPAEKKGKNLEISELEITNVKVKVKLLPLPGQSQTVDLALGPIKMQNLGTDSKMDTGILASKILAAITEGIAKEGAGVLPADMLGGLSDALKVGTTVIEKGKVLIESGKETGKEIVEGIKGIFKSKEE
jgi:hypothetical protein